MKQLLAAVLFLAAAPVLADQVISITYTDVQINKITGGMGFANADTCRALGLVDTCTQGQARTEFCRRQGVSGTTCPGSTNIIIYSALDVFCKREMLRLSAKYDERAAATAQAAWSAYVISLTQAQKNAICTTYGLPTGCLDGITSVPEIPPLNRLAACGAN